MTTLVPDQATDRSAFIDRTPLLKQAICIDTSNQPAADDDLRVIFIHWQTGLMMYSKNIDEPKIQVSIVARLSRLSVLCSWKMKWLLDHLDNWYTTRGFRNVILEWAR
jgi:hypothetical protein